MNKILFDTHLHTSELSPCGMVSYRELPKLFLRAGFGGIIITDHYSHYSFSMLPQSGFREKLDYYFSVYHWLADECEVIFIMAENRVQQGFTCRRKHGRRTDLLNITGKIRRSCTLSGKMILIIIDPQFKKKYSLFVVFRFSSSIAIPMQTGSGYRGRSQTQHTGRRTRLQEQLLFGCISNKF